MNPSLNYNMYTSLNDTSARTNFDYMVPNQTNDINAPSNLVHNQKTIPLTRVIPQTQLSVNPIPQMVNNQQNVVNNLELSVLKMSLKSSPQTVNCPYCHNLGMTRTEKQCSAPNILCCVLCHPIAWVLFQALRGKDISCYDAEHYCTKCGNSLANYKAC